MNMQIFAYSQSISREILITKENCNFAVDKRVDSTLAR